MHWSNSIPWVQTSGAQSAARTWELLLSSTNGFRRLAATKVNQDHTRHTAHEQLNKSIACDHYMAISSSSKWELNGWECEGAIEDQYNFCIQRAADSPQKCTREKRLKLHKWSAGRLSSEMRQNVLRLQCTANGQDFTFPSSGGWSLGPRGEVRKRLWKQSCEKSTKH